MRERIATEQEAQDLVDLGQELERLLDRYGEMLRSVDRASLADDLARLAAEVTAYVRTLPRAGPGRE